MALRFDATIARKGRQNNASEWIQCHDPRNCRRIFAPRMNPVSRFLLAGSPGESKATILVTVVRLLPSALMPRSLVRVVQ